MEQDTVQSTLCSVSGAQSNDSEPVAQQSWKIETQSTRNSDVPDNQQTGLYDHPMNPIVQLQSFTTTAELLHP